MSSNGPARLTSDARNRAPTNGGSDISKYGQRLNTFREEASFFKNVALTIGGVTILNDTKARSSSSGATSDARNRAPTNGESNIFKIVQRLDTFRKEAPFFKNVTLTTGGNTILSDLKARSSSPGVASDARNRAPTNGESNIFKTCQGLSTFREEASFFRNVVLSIGGSTILNDLKVRSSSSGATSEQQSSPKADWTKVNFSYVSSSATWPMLSAHDVFKRAREAHL